MNRIIEIAKIEGSPIIAGECVTFVWKGDRPPQIMGDFTDWERGEPLYMEEIGENIWSRSVIFPLDAYLEYVFVKNGRRMLDPYNSRLTTNGFGKHNQYFYMPKYKPTTLATPRRGVKQGRVSSQSIPTWDLVAGNKRRVFFYSPPMNTPTPLLVVLDGQDYLRRCHLPIIMDNLISQKRIKPLSLALVENKTETRVVEYACNEANLTFISEVILPVAHEKLHLLDPSKYPGTYGILGASMGGLMAFYAGLRLPEIFGKVLIQSGGYSFGNRDLVVFDLVRNSAKNSMKIWMEVGNYDIQSFLDSNRRMVELLQTKGYDLAYHEYNAGHNYPIWRDRIHRGIEHMFGQET